MRTGDDAEVDFVPIPGDDYHIVILGEKGPKKVKLPNGIKSKDVKAAKIGKTEKKVEVTIKHEKVNRRNSAPVDGNALDHLGK